VFGAETGVRNTSRDVQQQQLYGRASSNGSVCGSMAAMRSRAYRFFRLGEYTHVRVRRVALVAKDARPDRVCHTGVVGVVAERNVVLKVQLGGREGTRGDKKVHKVLNKQIGDP
jgi:hypothetical protein